MTDHLSVSTLNALADGEMSADQLAVASEHLAGCPACTSSALAQSLLKSATARAGKRYEPPPHLQQRMARLASREKPLPDTPVSDSSHERPPRPVWRLDMLAWSAAALLLLISVSVVFVQSSARRAEVASVANAAVVTEVCDQHIATLAASLPPQVLSTDRHTVKPWFQGKLPFSFNLPDKLPADTTLDGANLTYLRNQPVAQLLYSIGRHRVSVFVAENHGPARANQLLAEHTGFHVAGFSTADLEVVAVSDVDPGRLSDLTRVIEAAQGETHK